MARLIEVWLVSESVGEQGLPAESRNLPGKVVGIHIGKGPECQAKQLGINAEDNCEQLKVSEQGNNIRTDPSKVKGSSLRNLRSPPGLCQRTCVSITCHH